MLNIYITRGCTVLSAHTRSRRKNAPIQNALVFVLWSTVISVFEEVCFKKCKNINIDIYKSRGCTVLSALIPSEVSLSLINYKILK